MNVLIVDDSSTIRAVIKKALGLCIPHLEQVHEAGDGLAALAVLADHKVDVMLIDINMPRMNGLQLAKKVRQDPNIADLPIVVVSTEGSDERLGELKEYNIAGYIRKPFRPEQLREVLQNVLELDNDSRVEQSVGYDF